MGQGIIRIAMLAVPGSQSSFIIVLVRHHYDYKYLAVFDDVSSWKDKLSLECSPPLDVFQLIFLPQTCFLGGCLGG